MTGVLLKRGTVGPDTHSRRTLSDYMKMKAEIRPMLPQVKEHLGFPVSHQKLEGRCGTNSSPQPSGETKPTDPLILGFKPPG